MQFLLKPLKFFTLFCNHHLRGLSNTAEPGRSTCFLHPRKTQEPYEDTSSPPLSHRALGIKPMKPSRPTSTANQITPSLSCGQPDRLPPGATPIKQAVSGEQPITFLRAHGADEAQTRTVRIQNMIPEVWIFARYPPLPATINHLWNGSEADADRSSKKKRNVIFSENMLISRRCITHFSSLCWKQLIKCIFDNYEMSQTVNSIVCFPHLLTKKGQVKCLWRW